MLLTVSEDVPRPCVAALGTLQRLLEPDMVVARVIWDDVDDDLDALGFEGGHHVVKVVESADARIDIAVVGNIVCSISLGLVGSRRLEDKTRGTVEVHR